MKGMMILETVVVGNMGVNCYILASGPGSTAIIIDPGDDCLRIKSALKKHNLRPALVVNTHAHFDHIGCDDEFGVPVLVHSSDLKMAQDPELNFSFLAGRSICVTTKIKPLNDGDKIKIQGINLQVLHTPGHSPGGICLFWDAASPVVFTGDTLFHRGIGRTDFEGGNSKELINSIKTKLLILAEKTIIYPGHGPSSSIGEEKKSNPFLVG
jgi:glyoxylase-like metal-dependent hydrolase (beta-lactamase superfamily II)